MNRKVRIKQNRTRLFRQPARRAAIILAAFLLTAGAYAQTAQPAPTAFTWQQIKDKFEAANPTLKATQASVDESKAQEITAYLRPNPEASFTADGTQIAPHDGVWQPFAGTTLSPEVSYLHERDHKRELRRDSARESTAVAQSDYSDQDRTLLFALRNAFVQVLQSKAVLANATDNLAYWDRELAVNQRRYDAGDLALVDLNRLVLQRVQFESDYETALVNLRTSKIALLTLLNDRTPIEQFDVAGNYDFSDTLMPLEDFRNVALAMRPDLKAAMQTVDLAKINHQLAVANGSIDPTFGVWYTENASNNNPYALNTLGLSVSIPLRVFDKNQGEKLRTQIDIGRSQELQSATEAGVFSDVDSAYYTLVRALDLLKSYKAKYLPLSQDNRDRISVAFQNGGASLLDFLDAEKAYRDTRLAYLNLVGSYLTAAAQMNMAVGEEVLQ